MKKFLILIVVLSAFACTNAQDGENSSEKSKEVNYELHDIWALTEIMGEAVDVSKLKRGVPTLEISITESRINGFSSCNNFFGSLILDGDNLSFENIGATKMYCMDSIEKEFFAMLNSVTRYERNGLLLSLYNGDEKVATFKKVD